MGVSGLLGLLKSVQKPSHLRDFNGKTLGVDAYGWLHRGATACAGELAQGKPTAKFVDFCMHRVRMLLHFGVKPYLVFDGDRLPSKAGTEKSRAERRQLSLKNGLQLQALGKVSQAYQEFQKAVDISPQLARQLIDELKRNNIPYIVAPYEADAQLAYLESKGFIDAVVSEDSDLLVFGVKTLLTKLDQYGECVMIRQDDFTQCRDVSLAGWTIVEFRRMCILSGCDYLESIQKMGLKTAHRLVRKYKTIDRIIRGVNLENKMRVPPDYLERFEQAEKTFLYHWAFCPQAQTMVHLTDLPLTDQTQEMPYLGPFVAPDVAARVSRGDIDPMTKKTLFSVPTRGIQRPPLVPSTPSGKPLQAKTLDNFFKRRPLAELDPNSMVYSPSQQRVYTDNSNREWSSTPASAPPRLSRSHTMPVPATPSRAAPRSVASSSKRTRMCVETDETGEVDEPTTVRSKFFSQSQPSPLQCVETSGKLASYFSNQSRSTDLDDKPRDSPYHSLSQSPSRKRKHIDVYADEIEDVPSDEIFPEAPSEKPIIDDMEGFKKDTKPPKLFTSNIADIARIKEASLQHRFSFDEALRNTIRTPESESRCEAVSSKDAVAAAQATSQAPKMDNKTSSPSSTVEQTDVANSEHTLEKSKIEACQTTELSVAAADAQLPGGSEDQIISDSEEEAEEISFGTRLDAFRYTESVSTRS